MRLLVALAAILRRIHADAGRTRAWLRRPNPTMGGRTPLEAMAASPDWTRWIVAHVEIGA
nr:antitoxin Xre/MbcA/ParS toxin-binding domain-containing protein [Sphingomonas corticis]